MTWEVAARRQTDFVVGQFLTESAARDYARWRNEGRRVWIARPIA